MPYHVHREPVPPEKGRTGAWTRFGISAAWGVVMLAFFATSVLASMIGVGLLLETPPLTGLAGFHTDELVEAAGVTSGIAAVMACRRARMWWLRARLRRLRRHGVCATAKVTNRELVQTVNPRGPDVCQYTISVHWHEATAEHGGQRRYRFFGSARDDFLKRTASGAAVTVYHPPGRPRRFLIDIPYAPTVADFFL
ncbi:hypothetical protein ACWT_4050 [Actinoplanes sp. SE50]|uniref:hypothetical protein n=1 Tax=unclassified Actinoplanes TaxID=2626549 RepID=UPI00023EBD4C|nr:MULTISPECIES: hypothetical protein [unclassified Actinoplanes]AEV85074.1 hypothetical protein ACPL_4179 [Actinoplanes sp. SE50/110]ATO83465.1 hypothetical protein ACWT_4050 [Actinoplanes sp. SE50]SLM00872.1 hypothetical protein ACSP50_4105 [Actinoplanes sp. SE50/110]